MALGAQVMKNSELVAFIRVHYLNLTKKFNLSLEK